MRHCIPVRPSPFPDDDETYLDVPEASGALVGCDCSSCRELRLRDEARLLFGPWDLAAAWMDGRRAR